MRRGLPYGAEPSDLTSEHAIRGMATASILPAAIASIADAFDRTANWRRSRRPNGVSLSAPANPGLRLLQDVVEPGTEQALVRAQDEWRCKF